MCSIHPFIPPETAETPSLQSEANARLTAAGLDLLRQDYASQRGGRAGMRPIVALKETIPVWVTREGETVLARQPVFAIVGWTPATGVRETGR